MQFKIKFIGEQLSGYWDSCHVEDLEALVLSFDEKDPAQKIGSLFSRSKIKSKQTKKITLVYTTAHVSPLKKVLSGTLDPRDTFLLNGFLQSGAIFIIPNNNQLKNHSKTWFKLFKINFDRLGRLS